MNKLRCVNSSLIAEKLTRPKSGPIFDFTGTTQSPFVDLQSFYRVKPVSFLFFTRFLQGQIRLPFPIYNVITGSNQSSFFDLQGFYWIKSVSLFQFTVLLQGYPASRGYIFAVWAGVQNVASADNRSVFHRACAKFVTRFTSKINRQVWSTLICWRVWFLFSWF